MKPGTVGINLKQGILGTYTTVSQGDTDAAHVWIVLPNGKIATTGAKFGCIYGEVDAEEYLKDKQYYLLEPIDPLTQGQLNTLQNCHDSLMADKKARFYGFIEYLKLKRSARKGTGHIAHLGKSPTLEQPRYYICSQVTGWLCWMMGVTVGKALGKDDYTAVLPETFINEARATQFMLDAGFLQPEEGKPRLFLHITKHP